VLVLVAQPVGQAVWHPSMDSSVLMAQPQGTTMSLCSVQPGIGQRMGSQPLGRVVTVTVGQARALDVVGLGGRPVMIMVNELVSLVVVVVGLGVVVVVVVVVVVFLVVVVV
jgi:hypothetical protein